MSWWAIVLITLGGIILLLALLYLFLVVTVIPEYKNGGFAVWVMAGPVKLLDIMSLKGKLSKKKKKKKAPPPEKPPETTGDKLHRLADAAERGLNLLSDAAPGVRFRLLRVHCTLGSSNPMLAALEYGAGWAAVSAVAGLVDNVFEINERDLQVFTEYDDREMEIYLKAIIKLRVRTLVLAVIRSEILLKEDGTNG